HGYRGWAAFEGDTVVGTTRTWASEMTVPGGAQLPAAAVVGVTVRPTRRRGRPATSLAARPT
ncbi:MAG: GNAT family N-acetyltransferase, partial [Candidatus Limnocylindrales bacterium]